jgi:5-methylcytosine-specific restriction endonuclease McrA
VSPALLDLAGRRFGRLLVVKRAGSDRWGRATWLCQCDCGSVKIAFSRHLVQGAVVSCGCFRNTVISPRNGKSGAAKISGSLSHLYDATLTDAHRLAGRLAGRARPEDRAWRASVFDRDDYTCNLCGLRGGVLAAHHLNCWAKYPAERLDMSNGITICNSHHRDFHLRLGTRAPCTRQDYVEYKAIWYINREIQRLDKLAGEVCD